MIHNLFYKQRELKSPSILFMDYNGWWGPLSSLYFSNSSQMLVSRHPESCIQEIISYYCPQCLTRYMEDEIKSYRYRCPSCFQCPCCFGFLVVTALSSTDCVFQCGMCFWRSDSCGLVGGDKSELEMAITERERNDRRGDAFKDLLTALQSSPLSSQSSRILKPPSLSSEKLVAASEQQQNTQIRQHWRVSDAELQWNKTPMTFNPYEDSVLYNLMKHEPDLFIDHSDVTEAYLKLTHSHQFTSIRQRFHQESSQPINTMDLFPIRIKLHSKRTLRCRKDVDDGKLSILVQPKTFPLEGDSSLKQRGKWWVKDASAIHEIPRVVITNIPKLRHTPGSARKEMNAHITLEITNPKDFSLDIIIHQCEISSVVNSDDAAAIIEDVNELQLDELRSISNLSKLINKYSPFACDVFSLEINSQKKDIQVIETIIIIIIIIIIYDYHVVYNCCQSL